MKKLSILCLMPLTALLLLGSCTKQTAGPQGAQGLPGKDATISSSYFTVPSSAWKYASDSLTWQTVVFNPLITEEIISKGVVKIYVQRSTSWWELPHMEEREIVTQFGVEAGQIQLETFPLHGGAPKPVDQTFKLVLIPGTS
jgi:hypothetical protein